MGLKYIFWIGTRRRRQGSEGGAPNTQKSNMGNFSVIFPVRMIKELHKSRQRHRKDKHVVFMTIMIAWCGFNFRLGHVVASKFR